MTILQVGDIVKPGYKRSYSYYTGSRKYSTLCYNSEYQVTDIKKANGGHQLISLMVVTPSKDHVSPDQDGPQNYMYDGRNMIFVRNGNLDAGPPQAPAVPIRGSVKKEAVWIIVNCNTGVVAGSIEPPEGTAVDPNDTIGGTVALLSKIANQDPRVVETRTSNQLTEAKVNAKIAELLGKDPDGEYAAYKLAKKGRLPVRPVEFEVF